MILERNTQFHYITYQGKLMFSDLASTQFIENILGINLTKIEAMNLANLFLYPLGSNYLMKDVIDLRSGKSKSITRHVILFSKKTCFVTTVVKEPLFSRGKIVGVINKANAGIEQVVSNPCFTELNSLSYNNEKFSKSQIQILLLLAQFRGVKAKEISKTLGVQMRTTYMYKCGLLNKLRDTFDCGDEIDYSDCLSQLFHIDLEHNNRVIVLPFEELKAHCESLEKKRTNKNQLKCVNNFDVATNAFLALTNFFKK
ncbi:hypothetical protein [Piscirickettsia litoralis]|uniref:HTH luxR-type domain-containing protein n=1 Tax=Piscirickettsia litoralis TaxID=1891921 RepID=A0ABX3A543_9GAMM|nr:hypothetical protein [Piscirickettsia litoralis]ODN42550.1 hypothetical protein BGC07_05920 [Piscirickettsia litoralis]